MIELMKELCALPGPSGCEDAVREFVLKKAKPFADEIRTDAIGNVMVQARALGLVGSLARMRDYIRRSVEVREFLPRTK